MQSVKVLTYYHTIKHLRPVQIRYRLWYKLRNQYRGLTGFCYRFDKKAPASEPLVFKHGLLNANSYEGYKQFNFLNLCHRFENEVDWEFDDYGKLWTYNLNYFEYLNQKSSSLHTVDFKRLINDFIDELPFLKNANEPFPTSLRIINWVKYFLANNLSDNKKWNNSLYSQLYVLKDQLEYHLLGNHLLENGFALLMGGIYFDDKLIYDKGFEILENQLEQQILDDGAHFELSSMYHSLMLYRLLDCIQMLALSSNHSSQCLKSLLLKPYAEKMLGWLKQMMYEHDSLPHFNDSASGIAPEPKSLFVYGNVLGLIPKELPLSNSGYRRLKNQFIDAIVKCGAIGPDYIPGHAHADTFSFECRISGNPVIVDTGISTYEKNELRQKQRSTESHNTVMCNGRNSSEVWGGFRVARRAKTKILKDNADILNMVHFGYEEPVSRQMELCSNTLTITDMVKGEAVAILHFHPDAQPTLEAQTICCNTGSIIFENSVSVSMDDYQYCLGFNKTVLAKKAIILFHNKLVTIIQT